MIRLYHCELHMRHRIGWLRAAEPGVNDGSSRPPALSWAPPRPARERPKP